MSSKICGKLMIHSCALYFNMHKLEVPGFQSCTKIFILQYLKLMCLIQKLIFYCLVFSFTGTTS
jgi:hypothetical protein